jgi:hypothetical protein
MAAMALAQVAIPELGLGRCRGGQHEAAGGEAYYERSTAWHGGRFLSFSRLRG